ncbi:hypothetical protein ACNOYE_09100 [Nannocystaceae bacterium ST9]
MILYIKDVSEGEDQVRGWISDWARRNTSWERVWSGGGQQTAEVLRFDEGYTSPPIYDGMEGGMLTVRLCARPDSKWWKDWAGKFVGDFCTAHAGARILRVESDTNGCGDDRSPTMTTTSHEDLHRLFDSLRLRFAGRLDGGLLDDALAYWAFAKYALGIETLADYLGERRVPLDDDDRGAIEDAALFTGADLQRIRAEIAECPQRPGPEC